MKTTTIAAAIITDGNKIYATQRGHGDYKGYWEFPGGKLEPGETAEEALVREIREELDADVAIDEYFGVYEYDYPKFHLVMHCYLCHFLGEPTLLEHDAACWVTPEEYDDLMWLPADAEPLDRLRERLHR